MRLLRQEVLRGHRPVLAASLVCTAAMLGAPPIARGQTAEPEDPSTAPSGTGAETQPSPPPQGQAPPAGATRESEPTDDPAQTSQPTQAQTAAQPGPPRVLLSLHDSDRYLIYGEWARFAGSAGQAGVEVALQYAPSGGAFRTVRTTRADQHGSYVLWHRPPHGGRFRAVAGGGASSATQVAVRANVSVRAGRHLLRGRQVVVRGVLAPARAGRVVQLQVWTRAGWQTVSRARTGRGGGYAVGWWPRRTGRYWLRVRFAGDGLNAAVTRRVPGPLNVYRRALASWYGPGFYGNRTACGIRLTPRTHGVAHRRLPCGTRVTLRYRGRTATVRVIDRGPFHGRREFDLTYATKRFLGFSGVNILLSTR